MPNLPRNGGVYGLDFPPSAYDQDWSAIINITTTTYIVGTPEVAVSVTAPTSGKVLVSVGAGIRNNAATAERGLVTYRIFEDSANGALFSEPVDERGVKSCGIAASQEYQYHGNIDLISDLVPGVSYYFQVVHRSFLGNGTADIAARNLTVIPVP